MDVGANAPRTLSNTYFFDKCLGWKGICVEAGPQRAAELRRARSCTVVENCVFSRDSVVSFSDYDVSSGITAGGAQTVRCRPLQDILYEHGVRHVDFMSLDVEASEIPAMLGTDFYGVSMDVVTVETFWVNSTLPQLFFDRGFVTVADLGPDHVFARRAFDLDWPASQQQSREETHQYRHEQQASAGRCFDDSSNPGVTASN